MNEVFSIVRRASPFIFTAFAGAAIFVLFLFQLLYISQSDFRVAHHLPSLTESVQWCALLLGIAFGMLWLALRNGMTIASRSFFWLVIAFSVGTAATALFTHPTRSEDIYHDLVLARAFSRENLNPYRTTPDDVSEDPWAYPVKVWRKIPMVYGPLWTLFLSAVARSTDSLGVALLTVKGLIVAGLAGAGVLFWDLMRREGYSRGRMIASLALVGLNPLLIQTAIVDVHADALILVALFASYCLFSRGYYGASGFTLVVGGLIKYVPWLILPLPIIYLLKENVPLQRKIRKLMWWASAALGLMLLSYAPFGGITFQNASGLQFYFTSLGFESAGLPAAVLLAKVFSLTIMELAGVGAVLSVMVPWWCIRAKRPLLGYALPYGVYLACGTLWFQAWYILWILPFLYFLAPLGAVTFISALALLLYDVMPVFPLALLAGMVALAFFAWRYLIRRLL